MPNITLSLPPALLAELATDPLSAAWAQLCRHHLGATPETIHIQYQGVQPGHGHPLSLVILYRLSPTRSPAVMQAFMADLEVALMQALPPALPQAPTVRIRCFGFAPEHIHGRH